MTLHFSPFCIIRETTSLKIDSRPFENHVFIKVPRTGLHLLSLTQETTIWTFKNQGQTF